MTYTFSPAYDPYDQQVVRLDRKLFSLLREERWDEARQAAEKLVKLSRLDIRGHIFLDLINRRLGEEKRADYHRELARGLLDSIFASGDGRSSATALKVISPREEEAVCLVLGLEKEEQVLDAVDGRMIDRAICVDPETGNKTTLFFDITIPYQWAREKLTDE